MSSDEVVVSAQGVGKEYVLRSVRGRESLTESIRNRVRNPFARAQVESFWALRGVSFEIRAGECVGIIGRNGAGKSTLLKVLSRITAPTEGRVELVGRVGSLLEVGTGFHPELTGRENVFLNGAIIGMRREEIRKRFDEIVEFAGVQQFIDTPVKRYSSGMYVRLAFAVAAHLESEILIVDEVLAVGDVEFQRKCLGKMQDVASSGRTVLFVSHNMSAVQKLCQRAVLLRKGQLVAQGPVDDVVGHYLSQLRDTAAIAFTDENPERGGSGKVRITSARILDERGEPTSELRAGQSAAFEFAYRNPSGARSANLFMTIYNQLGVACTQLDMSLTGQTLRDLAEVGVIRCRLPVVPFPRGEYRVAAAIDVDDGHADLIPNALVFNVETSTFFHSPRTPPPSYCAVMVDQEWAHDPRAELPTAATAAPAMAGVGDDVDAGAQQV